MPRQYRLECVLARAPCLPRGALGLGGFPVGSLARACRVTVGSAGVLARAPRITGGLQWVRSRGRVVRRGRARETVLARACRIRETRQHEMGGRDPAAAALPARAGASSLIPGVRPRMGVPARVLFDPGWRPPRGPRGLEPRHGHEKSRRIGLTLSRS